MTWSMLITGLVGGIGGLLLWWLAMLLLRNRVGRRLSRAHGNDKRSEEIRYHNEAIYRDFEYFFKVTLALLGGIAFVVTKEQDIATVKVMGILLLAAAGLQLVAGVVFALFIFFHQKSKIERWEGSFEWWEPISWQECWMVASMFMVSAAIAFAAVPGLLALLVGARSA